MVCSVGPPSLSKERATWTLIAPPPLLQLQASSAQQSAFHKALLPELQPKLPPQGTAAPPGGIGGGIGEGGIARTKLSTFAGGGFNGGGIDRVALHGSLHGSSA